jgi:hypothetical protein
MVEPHIPGFAEFEKWREKKGLEIGCGIGTSSKYSLVPTGCVECRMLQGGRSQSSCIRAIWISEKLIICAWLPPKNPPVLFFIFDRGQSGPGIR